MKINSLLFAAFVLLAGHNSFAADEVACGEVKEVHEDYSIPGVFKVYFSVYTYTYSDTAAPVAVSPTYMANVLTPAQHGFVGPRGLRVIPVTVLQKEIMFKALELQKKGARICFKRDMAVANSKPQISFTNYTIEK